MEIITVGSWTKLAVERAGRWGGVLCHNGVVRSVCGYSNLQPVSTVTYNYNFAGIGRGSVQITAITDGVTVAFFCFHVMLTCRRIMNRSTD